MKTIAGRLFATASRPPVASAPTSNASIYVRLSPSGYCLCWWILLACHVFVGSFAFSVTVLHRYMQQEHVAPSVAVLSIPQLTLQFTAWSFLVVGIGHVLAIALMVYYSVSARQLTLLEIEPIGGKTQSFSASISKGLRVLSRQDTRIGREMKRSYSKYLGINGYLGFNGKYFEEAFLVREAVEITMQTYQVYRLSRSVPRLWINQLAVGAIVLNCVSSPLVHVFIRDREALCRLISLLMDALLDVCCSIVIPVAVILPYVQLYDTTYYDFPFELIMNDVWFVNAISENRQVLVTSMLDFVSTVVPHLSILLSLMTIKSVIRRENRSVHSVTMTTTAVVPATGVRPATGGLHRSTTSFFRRHRKLQRQRLMQITAHVFFVFWGGVVLVLHLMAVLQVSDPVDGCQLYVPAWYSTGLACSVMFLSCYAHGFAGSAVDVDAVLSKLDPSVLQVLVFSHCPALELPPVMTQFSGLVGMEIFNVTISDWPMTAALRDATNPWVGYVYLTKTTFTEFPTGLLHADIPQALNTFTVVQGNMTAIPESLGDLWATRPWLSLLFAEQPLLREVPESLCQITSRAWGFGSSAVEALPENCMAGAQFILISGSSLQALPDSVAFDPLDLLVFSAEHTNISVLPPWLTGRSYDAAAQVALFGSAVCENVTWLESLEDATRWNDSCSIDTNSVDNVYPWAIMLPQRQLVP